MVTATGRTFHPLAPRADDVDLYDIAHALAHICRFGGHVLEFHSVAQHSLLVAEALRLLGRPDLQLVGLLHDATEAYVGDLIRPLKRALPSYQSIEARVWGAIALRFDLPLALPPEVKHADELALAIERRDLMPPHPDVRRVQVDGPRIVPMPPVEARNAFLRRAWDLMPHERPATTERP
jgi:hypothetical protein